MSPWAYIARALGSVGLVFGVATFAYLMVSAPPAPRPFLGDRGLRRTRALRRHSIFARLEPALRWVAARVSGRSLPKVRHALGRVLVEAGDPLGLSADELLAASAMTALLPAAAGVAANAGGSVSWMLVGGATVGCGFIPWLRVRALAENRANQVTRSLPGVIDLCAMCMGAGLDFPTSLRHVIACAPDEDAPIVDELQRVMRDLELGRTRRVAMLEWARRVPRDEVRELVNSVAQAEDKGSPLSEVLRVQARTLRLRRSIAAETAAADAALMLIGPMTLIFVCILTLLLGPVVMRVLGGGLGP